MKIRFNPTPSITAYELAVIVSKIGGDDSRPLAYKDLWITTAEWDKMGAAFQRHFEVKD